MSITSPRGTGSFISQLRRCCAASHALTGFYSKAKPNHEPCAPYGCLFSFRYILDPKKKAHVKIQPPFIRPDLSERQITIKINDNGIHSTIIRSKVSPRYSLFRLASSIGPGLLQADTKSINQRCTSTVPRTHLLFPPILVV